MIKYFYKKISLLNYLFDLERYQVFIIGLVALVMSISLFLNIQTHFFRLNTDWDASMPTYYFLVDYIRANHKLPKVNPYISTGISVIGDPISVTLNPILTPLMVILGANIGIRVTFVICYILAGVSMWYLLRELKVSGWLRLWGALTYMTAGNMAAYFASGSIPKFLTYPIVPFYLLLILKRSIGLKHVTVLALLLTYIFFSGYTYMIWFITIITVLVIGYNIFCYPNLYKDYLFVLVQVYAIFTLLASPKLVPLLTDVYPNMQRYFPINSYIGSIHLFLYPIGFLMPLQINFYDRPFFQRLFGLHYNWYEYYAFISPFPLFFLYTIKKLWKSRIIQILLLILLVGSLYISLNYPYSPFYWLYNSSSFIQSFRIPQRIYEVTTVAVVALSVLCAKYWFRTASVLFKKLGILLCSATLISTVSVSIYILRNTFVPKGIHAEQIVNDLRYHDKGSYYVATLTCCLQTYLVKAKMPIINYQGYGWIPKTAPKFLDSDGVGYDYTMFFIVKPRYIFSDLQLDVSKYGYYKFLENSEVRVWKTDTENIIPSI